MGCHLCGRGIVGECDCPVGEEKDTLTLSPTLKVTENGSKKGRTLKEDQSITISGGRKRAASLYPIDPNAWCEWRGYKNCGGGLEPIVGCINGKQQHRQHGPIKATYHNERENIHLICARCHNRWHTKNDPVYQEDLYATLPHRPVIATEQELIDNFNYWNKNGKVKNND